MTIQQTRTKPPTLYQHLENLPDIFIGEILNGQLYAQSRPAMPHGYTYSALGGKLFNPFHDGLGGPGGWWIINEPEIHFVPELEVFVPDLAGWRRKHTPKLPIGHQIEIVPDWICEILSPSTRSTDREVKMPLYAHYGVSYIWLIDPTKHILEAYRLDAGKWLEIGRYADTVQAAIPPFEAVPIDLGSLWMPA